jgi:hypothetical protein
MDLPKRNAHSRLFSRPATRPNTEYRAESARGDHASALVFDRTLVYGSVVCAN